MIPPSAALPLAVVLPVFNKERALPAVLEEWMPILARVAGEFRLFAMDDGSTDTTPALLAEAARRWPDHLRIVRHSNRGHGQSCLAGYRRAVGSGAEWVFQIDSDGQCDPAYFDKVWDLRKNADVIYGARVRREDGWKRVAASALLRMLVRIRCGVWCADPNSPYRLMRAAALSKSLPGIPSDFFLVNVAVAALLRRRNLPHASTPIRFRSRIGGEPSVPLRNFGQRAAELWRQLGSLAESEG